MVNFEEFPNIKFVKFPELDEVDVDLFKKALDHFSKKVGPNALLQLSLKEYKRGGLRSQHEIHAKLSIEGKSFFAENKDWQLLKTLQSVLKKLEKEMAKGFLKE